MLLPGRRTAHQNEDPVHIINTLLVHFVGKIRNLEQALEREVVLELQVKSLESFVPKGIPNLRLRIQQDAKAAAQAQAPAPAPVMVASA